MPKLRHSSIERTHEMFARSTEHWRIEHADAALSMYVMLYGLEHMLLLHQPDRARRQLGELMYTGALLDWYYRIKFDDFSPVLRLWRVLGLEYAESAYTESLKHVEVSNPDHFRILRQVVEFIRDAFGGDVAVKVAQVSKTKHESELESGFDVAESYRQLALALKANKQPNKSVSWMRNALAIQRRVLDKDDPRLYVSVNSLASILNSVKEFDESIELYEEAIENRSRILGYDHPKTLVSIASYAFLLNKTKQFTKAKPFHERVLTGREKVLGLQHPKTLTALYNYASCLRPLGYLYQACQVLKRCYELRKTVLGDAHRQTENAKKLYTQTLKQWQKAKQRLDSDLQMVLGLQSEKDSTNK
jgi:tetratricopeptide (TPR) repeat protein